MKLILPPNPVKHNYHLPPQELREFYALKGTAVDADKNPILARHWPGALVVGGQLTINDDSPLARRFKTVPAVENMETGK